MRADWQTTILFWMATFASLIWLVFAIAIGLAAIRQFSTGGFGGTGRSAVEILIVSVFILQPLFVLFLIIRGTRLRKVGTPLRIVVRALYPLAPAVLLMADVKALGILHSQSEARRFERWQAGSITYLCARFSPEHNSKTIRRTEVRLIEVRHRGKLGTWTIAWPGKRPLKAISFHARTGSIGGSQGIEWRERDGRHMFAYLSFSDLMDDYGPSSMWVALTEGDPPARMPETAPLINFDCRPDAASYRE